MRDVFSAPAILLIGNDPTEQAPLLAWQIRNTYRLHNAKLYVVNSADIKLHRQAAGFLRFLLVLRTIAAFLAGDDSRRKASGPFQVGDAGRSPATTQNKRPHWLDFAHSFVASESDHHFWRRDSRADIAPW